MNLKKFYAVLFFVFISLSTTFAQTQTYSWISSGGSIEFDAANGIACDKQTNGYVVGSFIDTLRWDSFTFPTFGLQDAYYAKFDNNRNIVWMRQFGGHADDVGSAIDVESNGNIVMTGYFSDTIVTGSNTIISKGDADMFLIKTDNNGNVLWGASGGGHLFDEGRSITEDNKGNIYVAGNFLDTAYFGNTALISQGDTDIFLAKYNANGKLLWAKSFGGPNVQLMESLQYDSIGNCLYGGGYFSDTIHFDSFTLAAIDPSADDYLVKLNLQGKTIWVKQLASPALDAAEGVAVDYNGDPYLIGYVSASFTFNGSSVSVFGSLDPFLAKYSKTGAERWVRVVGSTGQDVDRGAVVDLFGNIYWIGGFEGTATFGTDQITSVGKRDVFVCKYDTTGKYFTTFPAGGTSHDRGRGISVTQGGEVFICGRYTQSTIFGPMTVRSDGFYDAYVAKIGYCNPAFSARGIAPSSACEGLPLQLDAVLNPPVSAIYQWTGPNNFSSSIKNPVIPSPTSASSGRYTVLAQSNGCFANDDTTISIKSNPAVYLDAPDSLLLCDDVTLSLKQGTQGISFLWSNGATTSSIVVNVPEDYWVKVTQSNNCYRYSDTTTVTRSGAPGGLTAYNVAGCAAALKWNRVSGAFNYDLLLKDLTATTQTTYTLTDTMLQLTTLIAGHAYSASVRAQCDSVSAYSAEVPFSTSTCAIPVNLRSSVITNTTVFLEWNDDCTAMKFNLRIKQVSKNKWTTYKLGKQTSFTVSGLIPQKQYEWQMASVCSNHPKTVSAYSPSSFFITLPVGPGQKENMLAASPDNFEASIYPNPNDGNFFLHVKQSGTSSDIRISVFDQLGRVILEKDYSTTEMITENFQLNKIITGNIVFLKVTAGESTKVFKVIIGN